MCFDCVQDHQLLAYMYMVDMYIHVVHIAAMFYRYTYAHIYTCTRRSSLFKQPCTHVHVYVRVYVYGVYTHVHVHVQCHVQYMYMCVAVV